MHDLKWIEANEAVFKTGMQKRKVDASRVDQLLALNNERKNLTFSSQTKQAEANRLSKEIGQLKAKKENADALMAQVASLKNELADEELKLGEVQQRLNALASELPNLAAADVPVGVDETTNQEIARHGEPRTFSFEPKDHVALGENLGMLDFEAGAKLTGARFVVYRKDLARLERALINYMLDDHRKYGYEEIIPPFIVNANTLYGTGQLPKFSADLFKLEGNDWYLIPTAEVPVTNLVKGETLEQTKLPMNFCAYSPCFRSEAGSYGKDTKGLIRLHQFNKVELVSITADDDSERAHDQMIKRACGILEQLELPYKAMLLSTGDMGFCARKCIDLEVWLPGQNKYREISSISNCGDFQARRASIRYRAADGKLHFAHTLNGSGLAVGRTLVAVLENYQEADGSIRIPRVLVPYMGGQEVIKK